MEAFVLTLAFGCSLIFSQFDPQATRETGDVKDGRFYGKVQTETGGAKRVLHETNRHATYTAGSSFDMGTAPDKLFAVYLEHIELVGHATDQAHFIDAKSCAPTDFVLEHNGSGFSSRPGIGWAEAGHRFKVVGRSATEPYYAIPQPEYRLSHLSNSAVE